MSIPTSETIPGVLLPDGSLELAYPSGLSAGPVTISIVHLEPDTSGESVQDKPVARTRLPSEPLLDTAIPAPFDLPRQGPVERVYPRKLDHYPLPMAHDIDETME